MTTEQKRQKEKTVVGEMISLYCRKNHHPQTSDRLCADCGALLTYAQKRSDRCHFMEEKTFCSNCIVHCYKPEMREKIRTVMRFSGPRIATRRGSFLFRCSTCHPGNMVK